MEYSLEFISYEIQIKEVGMSYLEQRRLGGIWLFLFFTVSYLFRSHGPAKESKICLET